MASTAETVETTPLVKGPPPPRPKSKLNQSVSAEDLLADESSKASVTTGPTNSAVNDDDPGSAAVQEKLIQAAKLRKWLFWMMVVTILVLIAIIIVGVILRRNVPRNYTAVCVTPSAYDPNADYFPEKASLRETDVGFTITYSLSYKILVELRNEREYQLVQCGTDRPDGFLTVIFVPPNAVQPSAVGSELPYFSHMIEVNSDRRGRGGATNGCRRPRNVSTHPHARGRPQCVCVCVRVCARCGVRGGGGPHQLLGRRTTLTMQDQRNQLTSPCQQYRVEQGRLIPLRRSPDYINLVFTSQPLLSNDPFEVVLSAEEEDTPLKVSEAAGHARQHRRHCRPVRLALTQAIQEDAGTGRSVSNPRAPNGFSTWAACSTWKRLPWSWWTASVDVTCAAGGPTPPGPSSRGWRTTRSRVTMAPRPRRGATTRPSGANRSTPTPVRGPGPGADDSAQCRGVCQRHSVAARGVWVAHAMVRPCQAERAYRSTAGRTPTSRLYKARS